jgi:hypothetical protein
VTPLQLKQTNLLFNRLDYLEERNRLNESIITLLQEKDSLNIEHDSLLNKNIKILQLKNDYYSDKLDDTTKQYKRAKNFAIGGSILSVCLFVLILL